MLIRILLVFTLQLLSFNKNVLVSCVSVEQELTLTHKEKMALDKFRKLVEDILPHDYMKEDIYLIKWLRSRNLNLEKAQEMLMKNLQWREDNRMDGIMEEDFENLQKLYPYWLDGRDKDDRPVGTADVAAWDPRISILAGNGNELLRFILRNVENGARMVRSDQKNGRNVTQFTLIVNLEGFNLIQHSCLQCIPIYIQFLTIYENYFPGMLHKLYMVNTPQAFEVLLNIARPAVTKETRDTWSIHGTNRKQWVKSVMELVDPDQIRPQFGGTKSIDGDADEFDFDL